MLDHTTKFYLCTICNIEIQKTTSYSAFYYRVKFVFLFKTILCRESFILRCMELFALNAINSKLYVIFLKPCIDIILSIDEHLIKHKIHCTQNNVS